MLLERISQNWQALQSRPHEVLTGGDGSSHPKRSFNWRQKNTDSSDFGFSGFGVSPRISVTPFWRNVVKCKALTVVKKKTLKVTISGADILRWLFDWGGRVPRLQLSTLMRLSKQNVAFLEFAAKIYLVFVSFYLAWTRKNLHIEGYVESKDW